MITANQLRAARALLNIDQRQTADLAGLSVPTIQRMEASDGVIRANVDSLMKLVSALENAGIELINPGVPSATGGRGVRLRENMQTEADPAAQGAFLARPGAGAMNRCFPEPASRARADIETILTTSPHPPVRAAPADLAASPSESADSRVCGGRPG